MKACSKCKRQLPLSAFSKRTVAYDGLRSSCKACDSVYTTQYRKKHPDVVAERYRQWATNNPDKLKEHHKTQREKRKTQRIADGQRWRLANPEYHKQYRERRAEYWKNKNAQWRKQNLGRTRFYTAMYRLAKSKATPIWLTQQDLAQMEAMYILAQELTAKTGLPHEVDHIVPIRGKRVCGLHVPANLQVVPRSANRSKSNHLLEH